MAKYLCEFCKTKVAQLPRHLRRMHRINPTESKIMSKLMRGADAKSKWFSCPLCVSAVKSLPRHLVRVHKLEENSKRYKRALRSSTETKTVLEKYRKAHNSTKPRNSFRNWLMTLSGGCKTTARASDIFTQASLIASMVGDVTSVREKIARIEDRFIQKYNHLQASTKKNYLLSYKKFLTYQFTYGFVNVRHREVLTEQIKLWNGYLAKQIKERRSENMQNVRRLNFTTEHIRQVYKSEQFKDMTEVLDQLSVQECHIGRKLYKLLQSHLLFILILRNACRKGVVMNMTIDDVRQAQVVPGSSLMEIFVSNHKTFATHGCARLYVTIADHVRLLAFADTTRQHIPKCSNNFFVTCTSGKPMEKISRLLNNKFRLCSTYDEKQLLSCSIVRKLATSTYMVDCGNDHSALKGLAVLMAHQNSTQQQYYDMNTYTRQASRASSRLHQLFSQ